MGIIDYLFDPRVIAFVGDEGNFELQAVVELIAIRNTVAVHKVAGIRDFETVLA
jgi:hypothetical protein